MSYHITFQAECPIKPRGNINGVVMEYKREVPFIPQLGMTLVVMEGDDFREVKDVQWSDEWGFNVLLEDTAPESVKDDRYLKEMKRMGWKVIKE